LLAIIRDKIDEQHRELKGLNVDQRVPVPGERSDVTVSYNFLLTLEGERVTFCRPEGSKVQHSVSDLLNGIEAPERRIARQESGADDLFTTKSPSYIQIFLSYCKDNRETVRRLRDDLLSAGFSVWWDQDILPGQDWKLEVDLAMRASHAVIICFSEETQARIASGIHPEIANAIEAYRQHPPGRVFLIPLRLSQCLVPPFEINASHRLDRLQYVDLFPQAQWAPGVEKLVQALRTVAMRPGSGSDF